jgi:hypothetical protein
MKLFEFEFSKEKEFAKATLNFANKWYMSFEGDELTDKQLIRKIAKTFLSNFDEGCFAWSQISNIILKHEMFEFWMDSGLDTSLVHDALN